MTPRMRLLAASSVTAVLASSAAACGESPEEEPGALHAWAIEAQAQIPDLLTLHARVVARSCAPTGGVCHNAKEYPDLSTPGNLVSAVSRPCNADLAGEPESVFDGCEPPGDTLESEGFRTRVAWIGPQTYIEEIGETGRRIRLAEAPEDRHLRDDVRFERGGDLLMEGPDLLTIQPGETDGWLENLYLLDYASYLALQDVRGGDPNGNGVFGAEDPWTLLTPGKPGRSYLWARITGTAPGSRMPLANQRLSNPEYVAIACWIEGLGSAPRVDDRIDYGDCAYARAPVDHAGDPASP